MSTPVAFTPAENQLVILMNETFFPPKDFDNTRISFGTPVAVTASDHDTEMEVDGIPGRGYYGSAIVLYTRVSLTQLADQVNLYQQGQFTLATICSMLNAQFNTFLDPTDLVPMTIPSLEAGQYETITLTAAADSVGWKDSVDIVITYGKPALSAVIGSTSLKVNINPLLNGWWSNLSGTNVLYNIDFTSYRDSLAVTQQPWYQNVTYASFADYATIADICHALGLPGIPNAGPYNQLGDYATSQMPGSNPAFDRVVVMGYVPWGEFYPGPLMFHYNQFDKV
jgi:hypothetical protein